MGWAVLVSSLQILLKKTNDYVWTDDCDKAFNGVKHALTHAPVLALPDLNKRLKSSAMPAELAWVLSCCKMADP